MMTQLLAETTVLVNKEYERASKQHGPTFNSPHEGYAVVKEELDEARDELISSEVDIDRYWKAVKKNDKETQIENLAHLYLKSVLLACEAIQTAAMAHKALRTVQDIGSKT